VHIIVLGTETFIQLQ